MSLNFQSKMRLLRPRRTRNDGRNGKLFVETVSFLIKTRIKKNTLLNHRDEEKIYHEGTKITKLTIEYSEVTQKSNHELTRNAKRPLSEARRINTN